MAWQMPLDLLYTKTLILFDYSVLTLYDLLNLLSITSVDILPLLEQDSSIALQMEIRCSERVQDLSKVTQQIIDSHPSYFLHSRLQTVAEVSEE